MRLRSDGVGGYELRINTEQDSDSPTVNGNYYPVSDGPHYVEIDWQAAREPG